MFIDELKRAAETAPRKDLDHVARALWAALSLSRISEAEAEAVSLAIEARRAPAANPGASGAGRRFVGSRPRSDASMERRRRWAAAGLLPPQLAARFTLAETAVLALVAAETRRRGDCRLAVGHLAAVVGVCESTVRTAIREAKKLGLLTVTERQVTGFRNDTNVVAIVAPEWLAWLKLRPKSATVSHLRIGGAEIGSQRPKGERIQSSLGGAGPEGIGFRFAQGTPTRDSSSSSSSPRSRR